MASPAAGSRPGSRIAACRPGAPLNLDHRRRAIACKQATSPRSGRLRTPQDSKAPDLPWWRTGAPGQATSHLEIKVSPRSVPSSSASESIAADFCPRPERCSLVTTLPRVSATAPLAQVSSIALIRRSQNASGIWSLNSALNRLAIASRSTGDAMRGPPHIVEQNVFVTVDDPEHPLGEYRWSNHARVLRAAAL
jgi:hypothetical protein